MLKADYIDQMIFSEDFIISGKDGTEYISTRKKDNHGIKTKVAIFNHETGECIFKGRNMTMLAGSEFMALNLFNLPSEDYITPSYNTALGLDNTVYSPKENAYVCQLFCMGTSGATKDSAMKFEVVNKWWIKPAELIPFQYVPDDDDLDSTKRTVYYGRKTIPERKKIAYYFKKFDSNPVLKRQLEDGTVIDSHIYEDTSDLVAETIVTNSLTISQDDGRDFFINTTGINNAKFNTIEMCLAWYKVINGITYFQDIRPCTRINFQNKHLSDLGSSWDIVYQFYF